MGIHEKNVEWEITDKIKIGVIALIKITCTEKEKQNIKGCVESSEDCFFGCEDDRKKLERECDEHCYNCIEECVFWEIIDKN